MPNSLWRRIRWPQIAAAKRDDMPRTRAYRSARYLSMAAWPLTMSIIWNAPRAILPFLEHEIRAERDQREAGGMVPAERFLEVRDGEAREHQQRDNLLHGLELRRRIDRAAPAV